MNSDSFTFEEDFVDVEDCTLNESHSANTNIKLAAYCNSTHEAECFKNKGNIKECDRFLFGVSKSPKRQIRFEECKELKISFQSKK